MYFVEDIQIGNIKIMKGTHLGEFEELVLLTIGVLKDDAYGIAITLDIKSRTGRTPSIGALHSALSRLEKKGFLNSHMEGATSERRGRRKPVDLRQRSNGCTLGIRSSGDGDARRAGNDTSFSRRDCP